MERLATFRAVVFWTVLLFLGLATSISPISIKGSKLYDENGTQFFVKDSTKKHKDCMDAFAREGIYIWLELAIIPDYWIDRLEPKWTLPMYNNWTSTVDEFAGYDNLLAFTVASATMDNTTEGSLSAPYVKAATRDMKAFRNARGYRQIPISYAAFDDQPQLSFSGKYLACGDDEDTIEMLGVESYALCEKTTMESGLSNIHNSFQHYNMPIIFTSAGCIEDPEGKRDFSDVSAMFNSSFQDTFSGAIVYQWSQYGANNWGLVEYFNEAQTGTPTALSDYMVVSTIFSIVNPTGTAMFSYQPTEAAPACPTSNSASAWVVNPSQSLPTIAGLNIKTVTRRTSILSSTTESSTTQTSTTEPASETSSTGSVSSPPNDEARAGSSMSRGSLIGAVVGSVIGGLALMAFAAWFFIRKRGAETLQKPDEGNDSEKTLKTELAGLPVAPRHELPEIRQNDNDYDPASTISYLPPYDLPRGPNEVGELSSTGISEALSIPVHEMPPDESSPRTRVVEGFAPVVIPQAQSTTVHEMPDSNRVSTNIGRAT
ncbi:unnamed protein product [Clonostachys rosea f. rosea IK726]|uniref:Uncharacterized protein n=2 Tax=Clonostachys rosea f. rosea IK726 TaxID=1349383 RepID=A0ACA9UN51_BIOOC|nr:unnamed protein product [Clonostachys rosea f. rosea IK726]CAG9953793.1 unnamed protein product [Clonostachys rosea f. rosea IK726]